MEFIWRVFLPMFKGNCHEWLQFWQMFESLIEKSKYALIVKLHYLLVCLWGEAKEAVQYLTITGENYKLVVDILTKLYGNKKVLSEALQAELF